MNRIRILVCRLDDADADHMTELAAFDFPSVTFTPGPSETPLDQVEAATLETGHLALRVALQAQWAAVDARLADAYLQRFPSGRVRRDGCKSIMVASRLGTVH